MNSQIVNEIIEELSSTLQRVETQSAALLEFIRAKGIAKDDELAPYLERAHEASSVRWRAARVRLEHLLSGLEKSQPQAKEKEESGKQKEREEAQQQKKGETRKILKPSEESVAGGPKRAGAETTVDQKEQSAESNRTASRSPEETAQKTPVKEIPQENTARAGENSRSHGERTRDANKPETQSSAIHAEDDPNGAGASSASKRDKAA